MTSEVPTRPRGGSVWLWVLAGAAVAAVVVLHVFPPGDSAFYPRCGTYAWWGVHCPGCGSLRAMHLLTHGEWRAAVHSNVLLVAGLVAVPAWAAGCRLRHGSWQTAVDRIRPSWIAWGGVVLLVFAVLRNLPWHPFTLLAP